MRRWKIIKSSSYFTVFLFTWAILWSNAFYSVEKEPLSEAKEFYENREYEKAIIKLNDLIALNADKNEKKNLMVEAYYFLSKIYFELREDLKMEENLRQLFLLVPDFSKDESNPVFIKTFEKIKNDPLIKGNRLYQQEDYAGALSILDEFIKQNQSGENKKQQLAFAYYLLAKIYFDSHYEDLINLNLRRVLESDPAFQIKENDLAFKFRLDQVRLEMIKKEQTPAMEKEEEKPVSFDASGKDQKEIVKPETKMAETKMEEKKNEPEKPQSTKIEKIAKKQNKKFKLGSILLITIGALLIGAGAYFLLKKKSEQQPPPVEPSDCLIHIESEPSEADVYINGINSNKKTPCDLTILSGESEIRLVKKNFGEAKNKFNYFLKKYNAKAILSFYKYEFVKKWGSWGTGNGQFRNTWGMAADNSGQIYVSDTTNNRIQKFSNEGIYLEKWYAHFPLAINFFKSLLYVYTDCSINKTTTSGSLIKRWGHCGDKLGEFRQIYGITVDNLNNIFVADYDHNRILKYDSNGRYLFSWGSFGSAHSQFKSPWGLVFDPSGVLYVTDSENDRIQIFSKDGAFISCWGKNEDNKIEFGRPLGISTDSSGNIYIINASRYLTKVFRLNGNMYVYNSWINETSNPVHVATDNKGNIFIGTSGEANILKYKLSSITENDGEWDIARTTFLIPPLKNSKETKKSSEENQIKKDAKTKDKSIHDFSLNK